MSESIDDREANALRRAGTPSRMLQDLDDIDISIIRLLQENGRVSNAHLARRLEVSEPTIRKRIDRLLEDQVIKVVAVIEPRRSAYTFDVLLGINVVGERVPVGEALAASDNCAYLGYTAGRYDLLVELLFTSGQDFFDFVEYDLPTFGQISRVETLHVLRAPKVNYDWRMPAEFGWGRLEPPEPHVATERAPAGSRTNGKDPQP